MAKINSFYFPHDCNAHKDPKCSALINDFGMEGYGIYWALIEIMHEQGGKIKKFPKLFDGLAFQLNITKEKLAKQIEAMLQDYELFVEDENYIWSERVLKNIETREAKRLAKAEAGRLGGIASGEARRSDASSKRSKRSKGKERKGKERKERKIKKNKEKKEITTFINSFNNLFKSNHRLTPGRRKKLNFRLKNFSMKEILKALKNLSMSEWHQGKNDRDWKADPDFLIRTDEQVDKWLNIPKPKDKYLDESLHFDNPF